MILANYVYTQYQTNFIEMDAGETVTVGPVEYVVTFEGTHEGSKEVKPENTFVKLELLLKIQEMKKHCCQVDNFT